MTGQMQIGSRWQFPGDDDVWVVGGLMRDEYEETALCVSELDGRSVLHMPSASIQNMATELPAHPTPSPTGG